MGRQEGPDERGRKEHKTGAFSGANDLSCIGGIVAALKALALPICTSQVPLFNDKKTEVQRGVVTCPRSPSQAVAESELEQSSPEPPIQGASCWIFLPCLTGSVLLLPTPTHLGWILPGFNPWGKTVVPVNKHLKVLTELFLLVGSTPPLLPTPS